MLELCISNAEISYRRPRAFALNRWIMTLFVILVCSAVALDARVQADAAQTNWEVLGQRTVHDLLQLVLKGENGRLLWDDDTGSG